MKRKLSLVVCTASLFVVFPVLAQGGGTAGRHSSGSDHSGHDENGSDHSWHDDEDGVKSLGDRNNDNRDRRNLVLPTPEVTAAVANEAVSITAALRSRSLATPAGVVIPAYAQSRTYSVLTGDATALASLAEVSYALSTAGPEANAIVASLMRGFSELPSHPGDLPSVVTDYNRFTNAASPTFLADPPPEFVALHTILSRLSAAASAAK